MQFPASVLMCSDCDADEAPRNWSLLACLGRVAARLNRNRRVGEGSLQQAFAKIQRDLALKFDFIVKKRWRAEEDPNFGDLDSSHVGVSASN